MNQHGIKGCLRNVGAMSTFLETMIYDICRTGPSFFQDSYYILRLEVMNFDYNKFHSMWSNNIWIHMWMCFASRLFPMSLYGKESRWKHQSDAEYFCQYSDSRSDLVFTCCEDFKYLKFYFILCWHRHCEYWNLYFLMCHL